MTKFLANYLKNQARPYVRRTPPSTPMEPLDLRAGDAVRFYGVRTNAPIRTSVQAVTEHYALCTWPSTTKGETDYAIISWRDSWRGLHGSPTHKASTAKECRKTLASLEAGEIEMDHDSVVRLDVAEIIRDGATIFDDTADDV